MSKSRKAKSVALLLALAFVFTSLFSGIGAVASAAGTDNVRLAGADRVETAVKISQAGWQTSDDAVLVYSGTSKEPKAFADALAAGPLAKKLNAPILLTAKDELSAMTKAELTRLGVKNVYIVGGAGVVSDSVASAVAAMSINVTRIGGSDREETAKLVAKELYALGADTSTVIIARSDDFPDALAAAATKGTMPILFAGPYSATATDLPVFTQDALTDIKAKNAYVVGGTGAVTSAVYNKIDDLLTGTVQRLEGATRVETAVAIANAFKPADGYKGAVITTGNNYADALAAGPYAAKNSYALLLWDKNDTQQPLNGTVAAFIQANATIKADSIVAVGGTAVVPDNVLTAAKDAANKNLAKATLTTEDSILKADGASSTLVTFTLNDAQGNPVSNAEKVEVAFTAPYGNFAEQRVAVQNGVATVQYTSEFLTKDTVVQLRGQVVEAEDKDLIGIEAVCDIILSPNPGPIGDRTAGAMLMSAEANQADRIIAYFDKDVNVSDYITGGKWDPNKLAIEVRTDVDLDNDDPTVTGTEVEVAGIMSVPGNSKALQILLAVDSSSDNALVDNADQYIFVQDSTKSIRSSGSRIFTLTDVRKPAMLSVTNNGLNEIVVTFSEPVDRNSAMDLENWSIDGKLLNNAAWGTTDNPPTITVGAFNQATGQDKRNVVTITLGKNDEGKRIYFTAGTHSVQGANIGDWAFLTDASNVMSTQTMDFTIPSDNKAPTASVKVESPEQWVLKFDSTIDETAADLVDNGVQLQRYNVETGDWENFGEMAKTATPNDTTLNVVVSDGNADNEFVLETDLDWTQAYNTASTHKNYYNDKFRIYIPAKAVTNVANGKTNAEQDLLLGGAMLTPDVTSPVIESMVDANIESGREYYVFMSEPVKLSATANDEGITPSQSQGNTVPTPTAEFIKSDLSQTIPATIGPAFVISDQAEYYDSVLSVKPDIDGGKLPAGNWTLVIRSISDDVGNTTASATKSFTVTAPPPVADEFSVVWAFADVDTDQNIEVTDPEDDDLNYDYIFVKFSKPVVTTGDYKNVLKTSNYNLDGRFLPEGTQIFLGTPDALAATDAITIRLPQGALQGINAPHVLNISKYLQSSDGKVITNPGEKTLPYNKLNISLEAING